MKQRLFNPVGLIMLVAGMLAIGLTGCKEKEPEMPTLPVLKIWYDGAVQPDGFKVDVEREGENFDIAIEGSRDWTIYKPATAGWITLSRSNGPKDATTSVVVTAAANEGEIRSTTLTITANDGSKTTTLIVAQDGDWPEVDNMPIADFREEYLDDVKAGIPDDRGNPSITLPEAVVFMGTVVSDSNGKNIEDYLFALQDDTAPNSGIIINYTGHGLSAGDLVVVTCAKDAKATLYYNLLQVSATTIQRIASTTEPEPIAVTSENIRDYESQLVKIENVQSTSDAAGQTWNGNKIFVTEGGTHSYTSYVKAAAQFATTAMSTGSGYLIGLSGVYQTTTQIQPRNAADTSHLTGERFEGPAPADEGKYIILKENMGNELVPPDTNDPTKFQNINVNIWEKDGKFLKEGLGAANAVYSTPSATGTSDASVRATAQSDTYDKASAGNNVFFGNIASKASFIMSDIMLGGTNELYLGFGYNEVSTAITVSYKEDDGEWKDLTLSAKAGSTWTYEVIQFTVAEGTERLSLRFVANITSKVRIDDIYLTTDQEYSAVAIPAVTSESAVVDDKDVTLTGSVEYSGDASDLTEYGFAYGTDIENPTTVTATAEDFSKKAEALEPGIYSWYAYVKKGDKEYKGDTKTFTIEADQVTTLKISEVVAAWVKDGNIGVSTQIIGTIVSDIGGLNYSDPTFSFMIVDGADPNSGIMVYKLMNDEGTANAAHSFTPGTNVVVDISGAKMEEYNGLRELTGIKLSSVSTDVPAETPTYSDPVVIAAADMANYQSMLVKVTAAPTSVVYGQTWNGTKTNGFTDGTTQFNAYTRSAATFSGNTITIANGTITGIVGTNTTAQLQPRNAADIALTGFGVSSASVPVVADGGNAVVNVLGDAAWTAAITDGNDYVNGEPSIAQSAVTLDFKANSSTTQNNVVKLTVATTADVPQKSFEVTFTQAKAPSGATYTLIDRIADLTAGTYYMAGRTGTADAYKYEMWTGVVSNPGNNTANSDLVTNTYTYADGELTAADSEKDGATLIQLVAAPGKDNTYYIISGGKYLYQTDSSSNRRLQFTDTVTEWVFANKSGTGVGIVPSSNGVYIITASATFDYLRTYRNETQTSTGVFFFKAD